MNKKVALTIYVIFFVLFGIMFVNQSPQSDFYLYYTITLWISFGLIMAIAVNFISPRISNRQYVSASIFTLLTLSIASIACAYFYSRYLGDIMNLDNVSIVDPSILKQVLPYLLSGLCIGLVNTLKLSKQIILKISYVLISIIVVGGGVFVFKYYQDLKYEGDSSIKFVKENYQSLDAILQRQEFKGKVVYIDLWFSSCSPCIQEFKRMPAVKESLKAENIEYLYLARKTSHPNDIQLWKNAIKKYDLSGWHIYMSDTLEENVWQLIEKNVPKLARAYPHYLIVNQENIIFDYNAHKPSEKEELVNTIKTLTNEKKEL